MSGKTPNLVDTKAELTELIKLKMEKAVSSQKQEQQNKTMFWICYDFDSKLRKLLLSWSVKFIILRAAT